MSYPVLVEHANRIEIQSRMHIGVRIVLAALGLLPLLAPYELLFKPNWEHFMNPFFFFAAFISTGATAVSGFLFFASVASLSSNIILDKHSATISYFEKAPVTKHNRQVKPLSAVHNTEVGVHEWSDGAPAYHLNVVMKDGAIFESGSSWSRDEIERIQRRVDQFLARNEE